MIKHKYRVFHNNTSLKPEELGNLKEIIVDQEIDIAWEARLTFYLFLDDKGKWSSETDEMIKSFTRIRIEIQAEGKSFVPLIDGPIVGYEIQMSSEPGESTVVIVVQDDSVFLNLDDEIVKYEKMTDDLIVQQIFVNYSLIPEIERQNFKKSSINPPLDYVQRSTSIKVLKNLAKRQGMVTYVLPGQIPGKSIGCFCNLPTQPGNLASLILLGPERNIETFFVKHNALKTSKFEASSMQIANKQIKSSLSNMSKIPLLGDDLGSESTRELPTRRLPPYQDELVDLDNAVLAEAKYSSYSIQAEGKVLNSKYPDILRPYQVVSVYGVKPTVGGYFLIMGVTHNITPSQYNQSFRLLKNARTTGSLKSSIGGIF